MERGFGPGFDPRRLHHTLNTESGSERGFDPYRDPYWLSRSSIAEAASRCMVGVTCEYRSRVIATVE